MIPPDEIAFEVVYTLAQQSLYSILLFPLIWGLVKCCRGKYLQWQHGLWMLILIRLVIPPDTAFTGSAANLIQSYASPFVFERSAASSLSVLNEADNPHRSPIFFYNRSHLTDKIKLENAQAKHRQKAWHISSFSFKPLCLVIGGIWLGLTTVLFFRFLQKRHRFRKTALNGETICHSGVLDLVIVWKRRLGIRRNIRLKADTFNGPAFTIGWLRPVVVLPKHLLLPDQDAALESVLAHELVHVKRWDDLFITLLEIVKIIYFFNPVIWYIMPRLAWTREAACDAAVLSHGIISRKNYGRHILGLLKIQSVAGQLSQDLAGFTSVASGMAFRLKSIRKEENMKSCPVKTVLSIFLIGIFLLPMSPVISSGQSSTDDIKTEILPKVMNERFKLSNGNPLTQYILNSVQCQNPKEVSSILWGDKINQSFEKQDYLRLAAATDFDTVDDIGNGQKVFVFYLLGNARRGVHRPCFHFIKKQNKLMLVYKSHNVSTYVTDLPIINGHYQIAEGWRADLFNGKYDDRVKLAWGSRIWFWSGKKYLPAFTDYSVKDAIDPSLLGTKREWNTDTKSLYEAAFRQ